MKRTTPLTTKLALLGTTGALLTTAAVAAPAAQAAARDGACDPGEFCLYFNSDHQGSVSDFTTSIPDYGDTQPGCYEYRGPGNGKGKCVKNEAAAVWNRTAKPVTVFFNSNYAGESRTIPAGDKVNLGGRLKNENASHRIGGGGGGGGGDNGGGGARSKDLSYALYGASGGTLTCGFDGYRNIAGAHEGIDFQRTVGSTVRSLTAGVVTNVEKGAPGGALSTIAIYNARHKHTVVYLHAAPLPSLRAGKRVKRFAPIARESTAGISDPSAFHTHVEVRPGKHTHAAKSVGDENLENPNPGPFWQARGFNVR
jgi:murein DD-endopeptidase MepM/ murein hydrolase activator NlpD